MTITHFDYVPILKWRQGEYQALMHLPGAQKDRVIPLIEITPPEFDFETGQPAKSIDDHLLKFGPRLRDKWGARPALLDTSLLAPLARMSGGIHPLTYLMDAARAANGKLVPVTGFDRDLAHYNAVALAQDFDQDGIAVRCCFDDAGDGQFNSRFAALIGQFGLNFSDVDLIIDLGSPNFEPITDLAAFLKTILQSSATFQNVRSLVIAATAFPDSMGDVKGPTQLLPRYEWLLYKELVGGLSKYMRIPTFGDYAIAAPPLVEGDMRILKPAATVRYTIDDGWLIAKGSNVRDNGFAQYADHCSIVANHDNFLGVGFSAGGDYIKRCGLGIVSTGNLTTWRWVGTNHHITKVVSDVASYFGT